MTFNPEPLIPGKIYRSKEVHLDATHKEKIEANAITRYFLDVENENGEVIRGGIPLTGEIRNRRVGWKGSYRPSAYYVVTVKKGRYYSTGEFESDEGVFRLLGDTNTIEKDWRGRRRGNHNLYNSLIHYLNGDMIEGATPIFLFEEMDDIGEEYKYIGMGFPYVPGNKLTIENLFFPVDIEHEDEIYKNAVFRFIVDTKSEIDKYWMYDLRIGQGNKSDYMPATWKDFMVRGVNSEAVKIAANQKKDLDQSKQVIETETIKTGAVVRKGQAKIRRELLKRKKCCRVCELRYNWMLIASHIVPWSAKDYENIEEARGDLDNVLLLCTTHDKLFDRNYITFDENGFMLISKEISVDDYELLGISPNFRISMNEDQAEFMKYHRIMFFEREDKEI